MRGRGRPLLEGLEDRPPHVLGNSDPVVLDHDQCPAVVCLYAEPDRAVDRRVPGGVHQQVLDDALDLRGVDRQDDRFDPDDNGAIGQRLQVLDGAPGEGADVRHAVLGFDDPAVQSIDVEQILQQPVELAGVGREPLEQVVSVVVVHVERSLERQGQPQDRGQRAPQLVRDGREEGVLHLVEASLRSVMSEITPWIREGRPDSSCRNVVSSWTQTVRPSRCRILYSRSHGRLASTATM